MPLPSRFRGLIGFAALALSAPVLSQQPPAPQTPVVRVTTRLVQVNVIVQDNRGRPVTDLTRDDFTVLDEGQPQPISSFSMVSVRELPSSPPGNLPPNVYSNRLEQRSGVPTSVTVVLLDGLNTRFGDQAYAREQIIKFLSQIRTEDRVALYALGRSSIYVLHDFSNDASSLLRALQKARTRVAPELHSADAADPDTGDSGLDQWLRDANERMAFYDITVRAANTMRALEAIANHLARLPGRKNLVWVSGAFPISIGENSVRGPGNLSPERRTFTDEIYRASRAINDANVAIYPVDARGLVGAFSGPMTFRTGQAMTTLGRVTPTLDTMQDIAQRTGGKAFYNRNDLNTAIRSAIDDSTITYVLAYYPNHNKWDGKFRDIKVKVNRSGARLRHRRGYFAAPNESLTSDEQQKILQATARSPLEATQIGLTATVTPISVPGTRVAKVHVRLEPSDLTLTRSGERWNGAVEVLFVQQASDGRRLLSWNHGVNLNLQRDTYEEVMREGLVFNRDFEVLQEAFQIRVLVRDGTSGALGSVIIPVARLFPPAVTSASP